MDFKILNDEFNTFLENNDLGESDIAIHCDSMEKAEILISLFYTQGREWGPTAPLYIEKENRFATRWSNNKEETCYRINETNDKMVVRGNKAFYERKGVLIVEFTDIFASVKDSLSEMPNYTDNSDTEVTQKKKKKGLFGFGKKEEPVERVEPEASNQEQTFIDTETVNDTAPISSSDTSFVEQEKPEPEDISFENQEAENPAYEDNTVTNEYSAENFVEPFSGNEDEELIDSEPDEIISQEAEQYVQKEPIEDTHSRIGIDLPINKPFIVKSIPQLSGKIFKLDENLIRYERILDDLWVQCDKEWELAYIITHPESVMVVGSA